LALLFSLDSEAENMKKPNSVDKQRRGRSKKASRIDPVSAVRLPAGLTAEIDSWAAVREMNRFEAICRLVELGLTVRQKRQPPSSAQRTRAATLAGEQLDRMADSGASAEDRVTRKRRLLKGPSAFRAHRMDRSK